MRLSLSGCRIETSKWRHSLRTEKLLRSIKKKSSKKWKRKKLEQKQNFEIFENFCSTITKPPAPSQKNILFSPSQQHLSQLDRTSLRSWLSCIKYLGVVSKSHAYVIHLSRQSRTWAASSDISLVMRFACSTMYLFAAILCATDPKAETDALQDSDALASKNKWQDKKWLRMDVHRNKL